MNSELVHALPDSYAKPVRGRESETATNTWRLFLCAEGRSGEFMGECTDVIGLGDIDVIYGQALRSLAGMYGATYDTGDSDEAVRLALKVRIAVLLSGGTLTEINQNIAAILGIDEGLIYIAENENTYPAGVAVHALSKSFLYEQGITESDLLKIIGEMLPAGVQIRTIGYDIGGFVYVEIGDEQNSKYDGTGYDEEFGTLG